MGDDFGQGGLAHAGRAPENHRAYIIMFYDPPQGLPGPQEVLLPHVFVKGLRAHPGRERLRDGVVKKRKLIHIFPAFNRNELLCMVY